MLRARRLPLLLLLPAISAAPPTTYSYVYGTLVIGGGASGGEAGSADGTGTTARFQVAAPACGVNASFGECVLSVAVYNAFSFYVGDASNNVIRSVDPATGQTATVAGGGGGTLSGRVDGVGTDALFSSPAGMSTIFNVLYIADAGNGVVRTMGTQSLAVATLAGGGGTLGSASGCADGFGSAALFSAGGLLGVAVDSSGINVYAADAGCAAVRQIVIASGAVTTLAGSAAAAAGWADGDGSNALFNAPSALTVDSQGTALYVSDTGNFAVRKVLINAPTGPATVTTLVGGPKAGYADGIGTNAAFSHLRQIVVDPSAIPEFLYVADYNNSAGRAIHVADGIAYTLLGGGGAGQADGAGTAVQLQLPWGLAVLPQGRGLPPPTTKLLIADAGAYNIRAAQAPPTPSQTATTSATASYSPGAPPFSASTTTFVGKFQTLGYADGAGTSALFLGNGNGQGSNPDSVIPKLGIGADATGATLYIADGPNNVIRAVDVATATVTLLAGGGPGAAQNAPTGGYADGPGTSVALFFNPSNVAACSSTVFVADQGNNIVRAIDLVNFGGAV